MSDEQRSISRKSIMAMMVVGAVIAVGVDGLDMGKAVYGALTAAWALFADWLLNKVISA